MLQQPLSPPLEGVVCNDVRRADLVGAQPDAIGYFQPATPPRLGQDPVYGIKTRGKRVLIVEDYDDAAEALRVCLQQYGHSVELASTGAEAIEMASSCGPDVIVCDLGLPDFDGLEVARRIRSNPLLKGVWLIALTAYSIPWDAQEAGFDAYLAKPADLEQLALLLHKDPPAR